jgi:hypothetical protein
MSYPIIFKLKAIECITSAQTSDSVYCRLEAQFIPEQRVIKSRFPAGSPDTWELRSGQILGPDISLLESTIDASVTVEVKFMEEELGGIVKMMDDYIGGLQISLDQNKKPAFTPLKASEYVGVDETGAHRLRCTGNKSEYILSFMCYELVRM